MRWCIDGHKVNFARGKIPSRGKRSRKCIYSVPGQETAIHCAYIAIRRRCSNEGKTRSPLKFTGVAQTRQQISAVSRPKFTMLRGHVEHWHWCFTSFFQLSIHASAGKIQPDKVVQWCQNGDFLHQFGVLCFQPAACSTIQTCILNSH